MHFAAWKRRILLVALTTLLLPTVGWAQFGRGKPKASLSLVADVSAVAGGQSFGVGIHFQLDDGWHIYWINSGESGLPPHVDWKLPEGFRVGRLQFPVPHRNVDRANITTFVHEGEPVLLTDITPPADLPSGDVRIGADVTYLICKDMCIREKATLKLTLPVITQGKPQPANTKLFATAHRATPATKSKIATVAAKLSTTDFTVGTKFDVRLEIVIKEGFHIQSDKPISDRLIATDVFLEPVLGIMFGKPVYPKPKTRTIPVLGKISEFKGKIEIRIPAEVDETPADAHVRFAGVLVFQACDDAGKCDPPAALQFETVAGKLAAVAPSADTKVADAQPNTVDPAQSATPSPTPAPDTEVNAGSVAPAMKQSSDSAQLPSGDTGAPTTQVAKQASTTPERPQGLEGFLRKFGLPGMLIGCFIYGLLINLTPCVLPLLSIKVLGFVQHAHGSRARTMGLGLSFGVGVVIFFVILGLLASRGTNVLHFPVAVIGLASLVLAMALSMLGVYTLQIPTAATQLEAAIQKEGLFASFGKGALAPVLGFACTGPLMAAMFGWATQQPPNIAVVAFVCTGLGMASPYMILGAFPNWLGFLPKPGNWMITFERIMGFLLLAMVPWLLHPLVTQIGATGFELTIAFLVAVGMACWIWGQISVLMPAAQRWRYRGGSAAVVAIAAFAIYGLAYPIGAALAEQEAIRLAARSGKVETDWSKKIPWRYWSEDAVAAALRNGKTVFVDFTSASCTVCKANKLLAINTEQTRKKMEACNVVAFQGDFTTGDSDIFAQLQKFQRPGVPLDLFYKPGDPNNPIVLPTNISQRLMLEKLDEVCARN